MSTPNATALDRATAIVSRCEGARQQGDGWQASCPAHEDTHPSLTITPTPDRVLLHCHAGCEPAAIVAALGLTLADLFVTPSTNGQKRIVQVYDYYDTAGTLVHQTVRYEPKTFRQRRPDPVHPGEYVWSLTGIQPVLYHLPDVLAAVQRGERIYLVEGEKDADALQALGLVATCNPMGAGKWRKSYSETLQNAHVVLLPDNDLPGMQHAQKVAKGLQGVTASLKVLPLPGLPEHGDVSDWFRMAGTRADLETLAEEAPWYQEQPQRDERLYGTAQPTPPRDPDALPYSDYTNALALVHDHGHDLRYCYPWHTWLTWTGTHWRTDESGEAMRRAKQTIKRLARHIEHLDESGARALLAHVKASLATSKLKAMVESAQSEEGIPVQPEALDSHPWLLNCANGTLDLQTGTLRPSARTDLLTQYIPVAYDASAPCPTWDAFLDRIMAQNTTLISFLQRAIGYALTGVIREHVLLILWGTGRNGKSTFLNILRMLLGPYAMKAPSELLMVSTTDRHPTERADLYGKRLVSAIETEQGRRLAEVFVKEATGGDPIRARRMREDFWEFQPTHKVVLATNHRPVITGTDNAIWERIRLVPFTVTIPPEERDTTLPDKLEKELPGILAWAVQGCLDWQEKGLGEPEEVKQATAGYRNEMDVLGQFLTECCLEGTNYRIKASELYEGYIRWSGDQAATQRTWGMALTERGFERHRGTAGSHWWVGIALDTNKAKVTEELPKNDPSSDPSVTHDRQEKTRQNASVTHSDPKNGINSNDKSHEGQIGKLGSLGSLGSLARCPQGGTHTFVGRACVHCNAERKD